MTHQPHHTEHQEENINLRDQLNLYLRHWPLFLIGIITCILIALLYLRYTPPVYNTTTTVIIKSEQKGGLPFQLPDIAGVSDILGGMGSSSITNELGMLRSKHLITSVVKKLNLNVSYFQEGTIRTTELFNDRPINVQILEFDTESFLNLEEPAPLLIKIISDSTYVVDIEETGFKRKMMFGELLKLPFAEISITPHFNETIESIREKGPVKVVFKTTEDVALDFREKIEIEPTEKNGSLVELTLLDPVKDKAQQILNELIVQYNEEAIQDKNLVSLNTANFIEDRLKIITRELDSVERGKEIFKKENQLTDIETESKLFLQDISEFKNRQLEVETQLELTNVMLEYLNSEAGNGLLPSNLGFKEEGVVNIIQAYNQLVLERDNILSASTERNPVVINLNNQIKKIRANVRQSLKNLQTSLQIAQKDLSSQEARMDAKIAEVPSKEKEFRDIERQQNIKEALYLFLLQKREETSLSLAVTAPKAKVVDLAYSTKKPVAPRGKLVLMAAAVLGLILPFLFLYLKNILNNKIEERGDLETITREIPIVGEIPRILKKDQELIQKNDRSMLAESFRILHTNLQYLLSGTNNKTTGNTIFITSTVKGEGKSFVAYNFALTLAMTGKKVLLVGADLRNPQLHRYKNAVYNEPGVSDYLINQKLRLQDLFIESDQSENLELLLSGTVPPNPSELWRSKRTSDLFNDLEEMFDYVVVDTAPSMLVTDTFLINSYADVTLYVSRAGYTEEKLVQFAVDARKNGKLQNVGFVLNAVKPSHFGYGNKYGYTYGEEKISIWQKIKNKAAFW